MRVRSEALPALSIVLLWIGLGTALSALTRHVADWFVMTDELLYERLAISIAHSHSPFPHVHQAAIANVNQLYPLAIAPVFRHGAVLHGFHEAHVLNAFLISSTAIPAYLLARRVTGSRWLPYVVAIATVTVPWIALSSFLLTEVAAYPAFAWAALAMQASIARPSVRNDLLAVAGIALAVLGRTQFYALAAVLPLAILLRAASERRVRAALREHRALIAAYAVGGVAAIAAVAAGHGLLGTYSTTAHGNPFPLELWRSAPAHLAIVALGGGLLPFVVGGAWLVSNLRRSESAERASFAWLATIAVVALSVEAASFDLRFGGGLVRERYLFYVTPLLLVALAAALTAARAQRWSLAVPVAPARARLLERTAHGLREAQRRHPGLGAQRLAPPLDARRRRGTDLPDRRRGDRRCRLRGGGAAAAAHAAGRRSRRVAARRPAGRDRVRVQAALCGQRHLGAAADARPERRLRVGRPHDHDERATR